jgi:succinoglycan biosynthesis transport protein ExoP
MNEHSRSYSIQPQLHPGEEGTAVQAWSNVAQREEQVFSHYVWLLRKHLRLIAVCFVGTLLATALTILVTTPVYTAVTKLLIEPHTPQVLDFRGVYVDPLGSEQFYKTQYEILKSRALAARVIREQHLETDPTFTGQGREEGFVAELWAHARGWVKRLFLPPPKPAGEDPLDVQPRLIDAYLAMLTIVPTRLTQLVAVTFNTPDPQLSARLANAHAQAYIRQGVELRTRGNEEAQRFLEEKLRELKERVEKSEVALNRYRRQGNIISLDSKENIVVERLADLNKRLTEAEAERIGLEGQVRLIRKGNYESLPAVINNGLIHALTSESTRLEEEYAYLLTIFKAKHPRLDQARGRLEESRRRRQGEIQNVVGGIQSAYRAADAKEKQLRAKMEEQKAAALKLKDASVEYAILTREVDTNRQLYDNVLQRMKETGVAAELRASNVSIIDKAEPPRTPSKPKMAQSLLLGALLGLIGGVGFAFLREYLDNTLKTPEEAERYLALPNLGVVPDFLSLNWRRHTPQRFPRTTSQIPSWLPPGKEQGLALSYHPLLVVTEAYRTLRTAILLSRAEEPPQTILFTSATHGEGKTSTVINTAIVFAQMGVKILVIDADLRRPQCHEVLGMQSGPGLTEVLTGLREPQELIQPTHTAHLFFLSRGSIPPNPADLVGSKKMRDTVALLQEQYDYILIDSPPVTSVSDAVLLSTMVEGVVLVVHLQGTPKEALRQAHARLSYARAKTLGMVLNRVDIRQGAYAYLYGHYDAYNGTPGTKARGN